MSGFKSLSKKALKTAVLSTDKKGARAANLYTGKKINNATAFLGIGATALIAGGGPKSMFGEQNNYKNNTSNYSLGDSLNLFAPKLGNQPIVKSESPSMQADGLIQENKDLGASGELVFGLHNRRHGR